MKKLLIKYLLCFAINLFLMQILANAQPNKNNVFDTLVAKYGKINSVEVTFKENDLSEKYNLKAKKGNKFVFNAGKNQIICNGKTIWNYNYYNKNVVISDFEPNENIFTLDYFFFNVLSDLQPISLSSQIGNSSKNKTYLLELQSKDKFSFIRIVKLTLDEKLKNITSIEIITNSETYKWIIDNLQFNKNLNDSIFEFTTPKNIEEIDLRMN